jgi:hypothetical protein
MLLRNISAMTCAGLVMAATLPLAQAAVTTTSTRGASAGDLNGMLSATDAIAGLIATELPGDKGWHPANPAATNPANPNGLAAFTDGTGAISGLTGLLNDFPAPLGTPVKVIQYDLPQAIDVQRIAILSGNQTNADGRIFSTSVIRYSTNGGSSFQQLGYFESAPLGSINNESGNPGSTIDQALLLEIFDDASETLLSGVTNLQFDFYAVDNTQGQYRDPFDGINPFTGIDDELTAAFSSPLIWEIDVVGVAAATSSADFNSDGSIDGADFLILQRGFGAIGNGVRATGDANGDGNVDANDLEVWKSQFGPASSMTAVPEPASILVVVLAGAGGWLLRRRTIAR